MIGYLPLAGQILGARHLVREDGGQQIVGAHALNGRRDFAPAAKAQNRERPGSVPAPACCKHWRVQHGLGQHVFHALGLQEFEHQLQRKGMLFGEGDIDAVVGRRGLQLEVEGAAETLANRQSPGAIDARAKWRMEDELHSTGLIEESLGDDGVLGRNSA